MNMLDHDSSLDLWHRWLKHISQKDLEVIVKKKHLPNLKNTLLDLCTDCLLGKRLKVSFSKKAAPSKRIRVLEFVHMAVLWRYKHLAELGIL